MAKTLYKAKFENKLPLGGLASGHIDLGNDGSISCGFPSFFAIKAEKEGILLDARVLQSAEISDLSLPCFEKSSGFSHFPFATVFLSDPTFPADVKLTSFSPFIPLNDTDSGIPAVSFTFEITSKHSERLDFSIVCHSGNINGEAFNRMGCTDTGEAYIFLSSANDTAENTCIATNGKNVSFCEYTAGANEFKENFIKNSTLENTPQPCNTAANSAGAIGTHFSLGKNESTTVTFCISWYRCENALSRNYYAQYFESSLECASYLFRQMDRLYAQSLEFSEAVFTSTLPDGVLEEANRDLFSLIQSNALRLGDGTLINDSKCIFTGLSQYISRQDALSNLFPALEYSKTENFYKNALFENAKCNDLLFAILSSHRHFILGGDTDALIEDWYYIAKCLERLYSENEGAKCGADPFLQAAALEAVCIMAQAVKDKKRLELFSEKLLELPLSQASLDISEGFSRLYEYSGFDYSAVNSHIAFSPQSDSCPLDDGGTFRCFFCTPEGFGYVEEGIDYIEINLLHGKLNIRSFGVPRTPRLVQYGGRNWRFENRNLSCVLDSELEITPSKKLTIFIDIKQ